MEPHEIKAAMVLAKIRPHDIARKCGRTSALVCMVIAGKRKNQEVRKEISQAIGKPISEIWPDQQQAA